MQLATSKIRRDAKNTKLIGTDGITYKKKIKASLAIKGSNKDVKESNKIMASFIFYMYKTFYN